MAALGIDRTEALKIIQAITASTYEAARKYWEGEMLPRHWRLEEIAEWLNLPPSALMPTGLELKAESPTGVYNVSVKKQECARLFAALPVALQDHILTKMHDLLWYLDQLPPFLKHSFKPPSENYGEWERQVEADMRRLKNLKGSDTP